MEFENCDHSGEVAFGSAFDDGRTGFRFGFGGRVMFLGGWDEGGEMWVVWRTLARACCLGLATYMEADGNDVSFQDRGIGV